MKGHFNIIFIGICLVSMVFAQEETNTFNILLPQVKNQQSDKPTELITSKGGHFSLRYNLQDEYKKLLQKNLNSDDIEFQVVSSDGDVCKAQIDPTKNYLTIYPQKKGKAKLFLRLKLKQQSKELNQLKIPRDIVDVELVKQIEPVSPFYIAKDGQVQVQHFRKGNGDWKIVKGDDIVGINPQKGVIVGLRHGEAVISISGYDVTVYVVEIKLRENFVSKPSPGKANFTVEYIPFGISPNGQQISIASISNPYNHINNNMNLACTAVDSDWFSMVTQIQKTSSGDKLVCKGYKNSHISKEDDRLPSEEFRFKVSQTFKDNKIIILEQSKLPVSEMFWLPQMSFLFLSNEKEYQQFWARTDQQLNVEVINGKNEWVKHVFDEDRKIQRFQVNADPDFSSKTFDFYIRISYPGSSYYEQIAVRYHKDSAIDIKMKAEPVLDTGKGKSAKIRDQNERTGEWHWTDFIILIMAALFFVILAFQSLFSYDKSKVL